MQLARIIVSASLDEATVRKLDDFCAEVHQTRSTVVRCLLGALLDEKQFLFKAVEPYEDVVRREPVDRSGVINFDRVRDR